MLDHFAKQNIFACIDKKLNSKQVFLRGLVEMNNCMPLCNSHFLCGPIVGTLFEHLLKSVSQSILLTTYYIYLKITV